MKYEYTPLDPASQDIRLVTILPGKFDDPIQIKITHAPLIPPTQDDKPKRISLAALRGTIPQSWNARETLEGRIIFRNYDGRYSSWDHPDPNFPRDRYELPEDGKTSVKFEALSYTWGSPKVREKAVVLGEEEVRGLKALRTQRLPIQGNLQEAIRHLRYEDKGRVMWIDALCINQDDLDERSEQVKRMGLIYTLAHRVIAWLGPGSPSSDLAFSKLAYLGRQIEHTKDGTMLSAPGCTEEQWFSSKHALPWDTATWDAISSACSRDWFTRLWIVQEIHLGNANSALQCGHSTIPWAAFRRAVICIHAKDVGVPQTLWHKTQEIKFLCEHLADMAFVDVLKNHHMRPCLNARDKIYGLLSLAPPEITTFT
ncbi:Heterokaryon incompatibility protein 6, OR allele [Daldinia childiae]|uniref:Heterokaryon incompatibility protein 6, OR allele n=1 Tax=Daldinia childiae TaxID=326645 RepID=UPI001445DBF1|nr:Heterokaryon incompatibility protein 6, OR allele [Daldinia childiae]KAF3068318.1 Heterokaryon incompatibility protein 6, OR allele [Daldinia childiae]